VGAWQIYRSTIGKKIIMAVTGLVLVGFVVVHMLGNTLIFQGPDRINAYSRFLHGAGELLWLVRIVLITALALHVDAAFQLTRRAHAARPIGYDQQQPQVSTVAVRTIRWGGVLLFVFIVFHLLHFTTGTLHPDFHPGDVYANVVTGLRVWPVAVFYVVAMGALGLHLYHGAWSSIRTLGLARPKADPLHRSFALVLSVVVAAGFAIVPLAVLFGWVR
jgi:succinate dehydrogenase / fumarate reductase, cytochrome b subunit